MDLHNKARRLRWACMLALAMGCWAPQAAEPLRVNVDEANPPFMYAVDGRAAGLYPALLNAVFREMKEPVDIQALPWRRALMEIDASAAGVGGIYKNTERLAKYDYSAALFVERVNVYVHKDHWRKPLKSLGDLSGMRVGVIRGWSYGDEFDRARQAGRMQVQEVTSDRQNFQKLHAARLDAVLAIDEAARAQLQGFPKVVAAWTLTENPTYLAFNKSARMTAVIERFDAALAKLRAQGQADRIVEQALKGS
jgi:polar amino acid transport system substrate-binding protein